MRDGVKSDSQRASTAWWQIASKGSVATAGILVLFLASIDWQLPFPREMIGYVIGRDFLNLWTMGQQAWGADPGRFYDMSTYVEYLGGLLGPDYPYQQWSYPPTSLLLGAPFGLLPYLAAFMAWTSLGMAALVYAVRVSGWETSPKLILLLIASPAALICIISGQNAFLTAAAFVLIYRFWDTRPILAGIIIGCLTLKPQLGVLIPFALVFSRRWTVFLSASATTLALAGLVALIFGPEVWTRYLTIGISAQEGGVLDNPSPIIQGFMPTLFMNLRLAGISADAAYLAQAVLGLLAVTATCWTFYKRRDPALSFSLLIVGTILATPYLMIYDLVVFSFVLLLINHRIEDSRSTLLLLTAMFWLPLITFTAGTAGIPGSAAVPILTAAWLLRALWRQAHDPEERTTPAWPAVPRVRAH